MKTSDGQTRHVARCMKRLTIKAWVVSLLLGTSVQAQELQIPCVPTPLPSSTTSAHAGTYEDPKTWEEPSDAVGTVYAEWDSTVGRRQLYSARFTGYPSQQPKGFPALPDYYYDLNDQYTLPAIANESWVYRGTHAGTYADPKKACEATYCGAINGATLAGGHQAFFKTGVDLDGATCKDTIPTTETSTESWTYVGTSRNSGTYTDPKIDRAVGDYTWPGAVHLFTTMTDAKPRFYAARHEGIVSENWSAPASGDASNDHWQYLSRYEAGSYANPKTDQWSPNATWIGAIYRFDIGGQPSFFASRFEGVKTHDEWRPPTRAESDENWTYIEPIVDGTYEHPKGWNDLTWQGQIHVFEVNSQQLYFRSLVSKGAPSQQYASVGELIADTDNWQKTGERKHSGTYQNPNDGDEITWPGAIHVTADTTGRQSYYRSSLEGVNINFPPPTDRTSNEHWTYIAPRGAAGTYLDPRERDDPSWTGAIHFTTYNHGRGRMYYQSLTDGLAPTGGRPWPSPGDKNDYWQYIGKDVHDGTLLDPKPPGEFTWPDAIHAVPGEGHVRFFRSNFLGITPPETGWEFPRNGASNAQWTLLNTSRHTGSLADPKPWDDLTWPGAIHDYRYAGKHWYFKSRRDGIPSQNNWYYPTSPTNNEHWTYYTVEQFAGNYDSPKDSNDPNVVGAIHATAGVNGTKDFYRSLIAERPHDLLIPYPQSGEDSEYFVYLGSSRHAGTYEAPKDWDEFTWPGRIHRYDYADKVLFFSPLSAGTPSERFWHYPTEAVSNAHWYLVAASAHAGTFKDPKDWTDVTWRGAIHANSANGTLLYYAAKKNGIPSQNDWAYPDGPDDNEHWTFLAAGKHSGSYLDPKEWDEPTWPGAIHARQTGVSRDYFSSRNGGIPSREGWDYPVSSVSNEDWIYEGTRNHEGTYFDPAKWDEPTWQGAIHDYSYAGKHLYFESRIEGVPSKTNAYYPTGEASNDQWTYLGNDRHSGQAGDAKQWDELTWPGALHYDVINGVRVLFRSLVLGIPSANNWYYPTTLSDNAHWQYAGKHAGTRNDPKGEKEPTWPGAYHVAQRSGVSVYYMSRVNAGMNDVQPLPATAEDNEHWLYVGKYSGTFEHPKAWEGMTWAGAIHREDSEDGGHYYEARQDGTLSGADWHYPASGVSNGYWTYKGKHAGTMREPKDWDEPTWPGAIHLYRQPAGNLYFTSKVSGVPSELNRYYPVTATSNAWWDYRPTPPETAPGINDFSRPFNEYTWVTDHNAYLNDMNQLLARGTRGFMLDLYPEDETATTIKLYMCHKKTPDGACVQASEAPHNFDEALNDVFLPYLQANRTAVVTLHLESYASAEQMQKSLNLVKPELAAMVFDPEAFNGSDWPVLQEMINKNKRLIIISDRYSHGNFTVGDQRVNILKSTDIEVENTYDLGLTVLDHDWSCASRNNVPLDSPLINAPLAWPPLFVMNQIHGWGSTLAHAADVDNNLTYLQRRVEKECYPASQKKPNYIAIDFSAGGDAYRYAATLSQGGFYFYERQNADRDGDTVCTFPAGREYDFKHGAFGCENDEMQSMELTGVGAGTRISLFDSPDANKSDDFTYIDVKRTIPLGEVLKLANFNSNYSNENVAVNTFYNNGLGGKISRVKVGKMPVAIDFSEAEIVFHEGNKATENIVCTVPFAKHDQFKMGAGNNPYGCDNDEIRSATIVRAKKGSYFSLVGNPNGTFNQGKAAVTIKQDIVSPKVIDTFDKNFEDSVIHVEILGGGVDGKSSYGYFEPVQ